MAALLSRMSLSDAGRKTFNVAFTSAAGAARPGRNGIKLKLAAVPAIKALRSMAFLPCSLASSEAADVYRLLIVSS